jgi:NAD(P)-dependent dehydrogenase (short-subunit alcohol dehydrogenase family)
MGVAMAVLAGRVAVATGASAGIGAGLAAMAAAEGATVVLAARRETELARVADGIRARGGAAIPVVTDLTNDEPVARLLATAQAEAGPVDVLVNNAGYAVWKPLEETALAEWDRAFAVNVRAAACLCAVLPGKEWTGQAHQLPDQAIGRDTILTTASVYWLTGTARSVANYYYERFHDRATFAPAPQGTVPTGVAVFPTADFAIRPFAERRTTSPAGPSSAPAATPPPSRNPACSPATSAHSSPP